MTALNVNVRNYLNQPVDCTNLDFARNDLIEEASITSVDAKFLSKSSDLIEVKVVIQLEDKTLSIGNMTLSLDGSDLSLCVINDAELNKADEPLAEAVFGLLSDYLCTFIRDLAPKGKATWCGDRWVLSQSA